MPQPQRCSWSAADDAVLVEGLIAARESGQMAANATFQASVYTSILVQLAELGSPGAPKTVQSCKDRTSAVST